MDTQDILDILHDETLAETTSLKCLCYKGQEKWCDKCDTRESAVKSYRKAILAKIEELTSQQAL